MMKRLLHRKYDYSEIIITMLFLYLGLVFFSIAISNIFLGLTVLVFLFGVLLKEFKLNLKKQNRYLYFFTIIPFLLTLVSVLYSFNMEKGLNYLWLRAPILIIPFLVIFIEVKTKILKKGLMAFVLLTIIASLKTIYNAIRYLNEDVLFDTDFTFLITIIQHPYFGVFVLIAFVSILEFQLIRIKTLRNGIYILFVFAIALSTSRLVYLLFLVIMGNYFFKHLSKRKALILGVVLSVFTFIFILSNQSIKIKFQSSYQYENSPRLKLWNNAYKIIKSTNNMAFGIGIGDYYQDKKDVYFFRESENGTLGYNPHSQIVEFFVTNGIAGIILLIITGLIGVKYIKRQNSFAVLVFGIVIAFSFTESILSRQYGVQLYSIFIPLIFKENFKMKG